MTTNTRKFIVALFVIALFAAMLSACAPTKLVASAAGMGDAPAYGINVNVSPRIATCDISSTQLIINAANALGDKAKEITVNSFLDEKMTSSNCIAEK